MGLLSALAGVRADAATKSPEATPPAEDAHFLTTLLEAFGLGGERTSVDATQGPEDLNRGLAELFASAVEGEGDAGSGSTTALSGSDEGTTTGTAAGYPSMAGGASAIQAEGAARAGLGAPSDASSGETRSEGVTDRGDVSETGRAPNVVARDGVAAEDPAAEASVVPTVDAPSAPADASMTASETPVAAVEALASLERADSSPDKLDPALREKVERVIERMRDEFGHNVKVVEGYRSQARQDHLYAQGRTRPGEPVTWTTRSWHTDGLAADLVVDGSYDDRLAYARLQRVAREEGLRTLGSKDPGHVELPGSRAASAESVAEGPSGPTRRFVGVAVPAATASVAAVAAVARPGQWVTTPAAAPTPDAPTPIEEPVVAMGDATVDVEEGVRVEELEVASQRNARAEAAESEVAAARAARAEAVTTDLVEADALQRREMAAPGAAASVADGATGPRVADIDGTSTLDRVERIQELRELARAAAPSRVSVRLGDGADQIRVGLLDRSVDADLALADAEQAALIRARVAELHRSLESRGLELGALSVNGTAGLPGANGMPVAPVDGAAELLRTLFGSTFADSGQGRERSSADQHLNQGGRGSDDRRREHPQGQE